MKNKGKWLLFVLVILCCMAFGAYYLYFGGEKDNNAPTIQLTSDYIEASVYEDQTEMLKNVTAWDAEDGDVTSSAVIESVSDIFDDNQATVTYAAFDSAGNVSKAQCTVVYTDYEGPRFTLSAPLLFREGSYFDVMDVICAEDAIDGDLTNRIKGTLISGGTAIVNKGEYQVEFRVTNSLGDTVYLNAPVEVVSASQNITRLMLREYLIYVKQNTVFDAKSYLETEDEHVCIDSDVNMDEPGVYTVTYNLNADMTRLIVVVEE